MEPEDMSVDEILTWLENSECGLYNMEKKDGLWSVGVLHPEIPRLIKGEASTLHGALCDVATTLSEEINKQEKIHG